MRGLSGSSSAIDGNMRPAYTRGSGRKRDTLAYGNLCGPWDPYCSSNVSTLSLLLT